MMSLIARENLKTRVEMRQNYRMWLRANVCLRVCVCVCTRAFTFTGLRVGLEDESFGAGAGVGARRVSAQAVVAEQPVHQALIDVWAEK